MIAPVHQNVYLFDGTVKDNICLGEPFEEEEIIQALVQSGADGFIQELPQGLNTMVGRRRLPSFRRTMSTHCCGSRIDPTAPDPDSGRRNFVAGSFHCRRYRTTPPGHERLNHAHHHPPPFRTKYRAVSRRNPNITFLN